MQHDFSDDKLLACYHFLMQSIEYLTLAAQLLSSSDPGSTQAFPLQGFVSSSLTHDGLSSDTRQPAKQLIDLAHKNYASASLQLGGLLPRIPKAAVKLSNCFVDKMRRSARMAEALHNVQVMLEAYMDVAAMLQLQGMSRVWRKTVMIIA
jgi:hypothetical protein